jgi:hypothetical protein
MLMVGCGDFDALIPIEEPVPQQCLIEEVTINHPTQTEDLIVTLEFAQHNYDGAKFASFTLEDTTVNLTVKTPVLRKKETYGPLTFLDVSTDGNFIVSYCLTKR